MEEQESRSRSNRSIECAGREGVIMSLKVDNPDINTARSDLKGSDIRTGSTNPVRCTRHRRARQLVLHARIGSGNYTTSLSLPTYERERGCTRTGRDGRSDTLEWHTDCKWHLVPHILNRVGVTNNDNTTCEPANDGSPPHCGW